MAGRIRNGLAGILMLGASAGLGGCGAIIGAWGEENAAHVRGHYEVEAAKIRAGHYGGATPEQPNNYIRNGRLYMSTGLTTGVYDANLDGEIDGRDLFWGDRPMALLPGEIGPKFQQGIVPPQKVISAVPLSGEVKTASAEGKRVYIVSEEITFRDSKGDHTFKRSEIVDRDRDGVITMFDIEPYIEKEGTIINGTIVAGDKKFESK